MEAYFPCPSPFKKSNPSGPVSWLSGLKVFAVRSDSPSSVPRTLTSTHWYMHMYKHIHKY